MVDWNLVREWLQALTAPMIAVVGAWIAYRQWRTNALKVKLDLYDRRLRVFERLRAFLSEIMRDADVTTESASRFRAETIDAAFLFGPEIDEYLQTVFRRALDLSVANARYRAYLDGSRPPDHDHLKNTDRMDEALRWLTDQPELAMKKFSRYLDFSEAR